MISTSNKLYYKYLWQWVLFVVVIAGQTLAAAESKAEKVKDIYGPRHDPADMPFRNLPMAEATRTVVVPLATNLHLAFDTEKLRTITVWNGQTVNLWGSVYHGAKDRFYADFKGDELWHSSQIFPWEIKELTQKSGYTNVVPVGRYLGLSTKGGHTTFLYELKTAEGELISVHETPRHNPELGVDIVERRLEIGPTQRSLSFLAHQERGKQITNNIPPGMFVYDRGTNVLLVTARATCRLILENQTESITTTNVTWKEVKNDSLRVAEVVTEKISQCVIRIPLHKEPVAVEVLSLTAKTPEEALGKLRAMPKTRLLPPALAYSHSKEADVGKPIKVVPSTKGFVLPAGDESYKLEAFPLPPEIELQVTGLDFLPTGELAVCTWLGDVYIVENAQGPAGTARYRRFARGLNEPGGLKVIQGNIYVVQKHELTRLVDTDGNGEADLFECLNHDWGYTGNYHDFSFGPAVTANGDMYIMRNGNRGLYEVPLMGWCLQLSNSGKTMKPFCDGLRSPNGFGVYHNNVFMTENQGNWVGACKLTHLQQDRFYGFPSTSPAPKEHFENPQSFTAPAVWFPYTLAKSTSGFDLIPDDDRFGPFKGQLMVGDFQNAILMRVCLEKVQGEWQGAVFPFAKGFNSGVNRLAFGPDGKLYVGGCKNKAWAAVAPKDYSLDRVSFTGKTPFEVKTVNALKDGFELTFTQPVMQDTALLADSYDVVQFNYEYHQKYGSAEMDHEGKPNSSTGIKVLKAVVSPDKLKVRLTLSGWKTGYVTMVRCLDITNGEGKKLRHDTFWYTLNRLPE